MSQRYRNPGYSLDEGRFQQRSRTDERGFEDRGTPRSSYGYGEGLGERIGEALGIERRPAPKNYRRSDERILDEVCYRLWANPDIDASEIEVEVKDAKVTLKGIVEERWVKRLAEDVADEVFGVEDVDNDLRVRGSITEKFLGDTRDKAPEPGAVTKTAAASATTTTGGVRR
ncbi:BON domain-containing protein [Myxococcota bacterium]|nr:BON domain-containing protein [Myxococcota bacterium]